MQRPRCSVFIATSLDGYIARPDGTFDFLSIVERPNEDYGFADFFASVDALVIGRNTYETALAFPEWPYAGKRCIVLTHRETPSVHGDIPGMSDCVRSATTTCVPGNILGTMRPPRPQPPGWADGYWYQ